MANTPIKTLADCTENQRKFLAALGSQEALTIPSRQARWEWCVEQAGYPKGTKPATVIAGIPEHLIKDVINGILVISSIEAVWTLADAASSGIIDAQTKDRLAASRDILDRTTPKKGEEQSKQQQPIAVLILPAKSEPIRLVEARVIEHEDLPTSQEG